MNKPAIFRSLRAKACAITLIVQLPLIALFTTWYTQSQNAMRAELVQANVSNALICCEKINMSLKISSAQLTQYYQPEWHVDYMKYLTGKLPLFYFDLQQGLSRLNSDFNPLHTYFAFNTEDSYYVENLGGKLGYEEHLFLHDVLQNSILPTKQWFVYELLDKPYLFYTLNIHGFIFGACASWETVLNTYLPALSGQNSRIVLMDSDGTGLTDLEWYQGFGNNLHRITTNPQGMNVVAEDDVMYHIVKVDKGDTFEYCLALQTGRRTDVAELLRRTPMLLLVPAFLVLSVIVFLYFFWRCVIRPVERIRFGFRCIRSNQLDIRMPETGCSTEMNDLNHSFNSMVRRINDLKVDVYEKKLEKEKYEQQWLLSNLRPHFILNNLSTIDNLASCRDYAGIHALVMCLSNYLRNSIGFEFAVVTLDNCLNTAESYLRLMQFLHPGQIVYDRHCPEEIAQLQFPPLVICALCENAIKYGFAPPNVLRIHFECEVCEGHLRVTVSNNGPHFPLDVYEDINFSDSRPIHNSYHLGLQSLKRRLDLMYGEECRLSVENRIDGVAVTIERALNGEEIVALENPSS